MQTLIHVAYLLASALFIFGLRQLAQVKTARRGNLMAATAMLIAIIAALIDLGTIDYAYIIVGMLIGALIGGLFAVKVAMTAMPQMVAIFNGMGGGASALVAFAYFFDGVVVQQPGTTSVAAVLGGDVALTTGLSILIGGVTFTGSWVAFAKLQEIISGKPTLFAGQHLLNLMIFVATTAVGIYACFFANTPETLVSSMSLLALGALLLGILLVIPIGGADMPVVISLLNSYSGIAAAMTGFVLQNNLLIISGSLVGASGLILTRIMCKAMNRSLANVLFGGFGAEQTAMAGSREYENIKETGAEESAMLMEAASNVIVVPGYGLAVAQAQHIVQEMAELLEGKGCQVRYAIHPVAGRMPGHMNVLLAEANVPYDRLVEMDQINSEFKNSDVTLIVGANDVVNPAAIKDKASPIYGMPILNVHESQTVIVIKRSLSPGFAGIKNELFEYPNTLMLFGDAKKVLMTMVEELKNL